MQRIEFTTLFTKQRKTAPPEIEIAFRDAFALFKKEAKNKWTLGKC